MCRLALSSIVCLSLSVVFSVGCALDGSSSNRRGECHIGGCSSQLCSDRADIATTCEWRDEYACYREVTCERQASGACGWTETPELLACLAESRSAPE